MVSEETHRAILVGCGGMSHVWTKAAAAIDGVEIVGFVDLEVEAAKKRAADSDWPDAPVGTDLESMLRETKPEAVFDCTVPAAHVNVTLTALKHGCHVLGEKPLADSMENARRSVNAAREAGKVYSVIQNRRYYPGVRRVRRLLESGELGAITTVNSDFYMGAHFDGFRAVMDHVLLLDMAIHTFDTARFISSTDPRSVYCHEWNPTGSWYKHGASAMAIFEMTNGVVYNYRGSWCPEGLNTTWESQWRIVCEHGTVVWDGNDGIEAVKVKDASGFISEFDEVDVPDWESPEGIGAHEGVMRDFVRSIETGQPPETVCTDNIKSLAMVFGAIESATDGEKREIEIPD